ncbi:MAG: two-component system chemotaxis response regulator CheB [Candidatus Azotimanducaceae bacterium]|jgi:two-component system chemotaxis response regulator CheB
MKKIRVLVIDDSALIRQMLTSALNQASDIEVVGAATDPISARDMIKTLNPDVLTLDVEMPKMDGISFLANLMRLRPMPVIMVSTLTSKASAVTFSALELGAVDFIEKPNASLSGDIEGFSREVQEKVRVAAGANVQQLKVAPRRALPTNLTLPEVGAESQVFSHIIAIGASTGGTEAIKEVLSGLPANCPPIVIAQHIPEKFSASFAKRLNDTCAIRAVEASHNQPLVPGTAYVAPGDQHLTIRNIRGKYHCWLDRKPKVNRHRPSVDVLFDSVVESVNGAKVIGVILTGMGSDGAAGLKRMCDAGIFTIAQDQASSVVWGMPGAAVKLDGVCQVMPLTKIAPYLLKLPKKPKRQRAI